MRCAAVFLLALVGACASTRPESLETDVVEGYAARRPIMVRVQAPALLGEALYRALLAKDYSPLAPGAAGIPEAGRLEGALLTEGPPWSATALLRGADGEMLYRVEARGVRGSVADLAEALLRDLPRK